MLWIFILPVLTLSQCAKVKCSDDLDENICYEFQPDKDTMMVNQCPNNMICSVNNSINLGAFDFQMSPQSCKDNDFIAVFKMPGELCATSSECWSNLCLSGICKGFEIGEVCGGIEDCQPGLICSGGQGAGFCKNQVPDGGSCNSGFDCRNASDCFNGVCTPYLSVPIGKTVQTQIALNPELLCTTGYLSSEQTCSFPPVNLKQPDKKCEKDSDCPQLIPETDENLTGKCMCGFNEDGDQYCTAAQGDQEYKDFIRYFQQVASQNSGCHSKLAYSPRCPLLKNTFIMQHFLRTFYTFYYRHALINTEKCAASIINPYAPDYQYLKEPGSEGEDDGDTAFALVIAAVIAIIIISTIVCIICIRRCKSSRAIDMDPDELEPQIAFTRLQRENLTGPSESKFRIDHFEFDNNSALFLLRGIPIGQRVDHVTLEPQDDTDQIVLARPSTPIDDISEDTQRDLIRNNTSGSALASPDNYRNGL